MPRGQAHHTELFPYYLGPPDQPPVGWAFNKELCRTMVGQAAANNADSAADIEAGWWREHQEAEERERKEKDQTIKDLEKELKQRQVDHEKELRARDEEFWRMMEYGMYHGHGYGEAGPSGYGGRRWYYRS